MYDSPLTLDDTVPGAEFHEGEYVQLYNAGSETADLGGYQLKQGGQVVNLSGSIPAGGRVFVGYGTQESDLTDVVEAVSGFDILIQNELWLPDGGAVLELLKEDVVVDQLAYGKFYSLDAENPYLGSSSLKSVQRHVVGGSLGDPIGPPVVGGVGAVVAIIDPEGEPVVLNQASVGRFALSRGGKRYELKNHLGNVLAVVTDLKLGQGQLNVAPAVVDFYLPEVVEVSDYFPFGWQLPGRNWRSGDRYRYAFQGQEGDDAWSGEEASVFFKYRVHDARIGRFLSVDPLAAEYAGNSVYAFSENRVIDCSELEGAESRIARFDIKLANGKAILISQRVEEIPRWSTTSNYFGFSIYSRRKLGHGILFEIHYTDEEGSECDVSLYSPEPKRIHLQGFGVRLQGAGGNEDSEFDFKAVQMGPPIDIGELLAIAKMKQPRPNEYGMRSNILLKSNQGSLRSAFAAAEINKMKQILNTARNMRKVFEGSTSFRIMLREMLPKLPFDPILDNLPKTPIGANRYEVSSMPSSKPKPDTNYTWTEADGFHGTKDKDAFEDERPKQNIQKIAVEE